MSTIRKAEEHSRTMGKLQTMSGSTRTYSERDSGFSDASNIDSDGLSHSASKRGAQRLSELVAGSQPPQLAMVGGSYSNMSPVIIMNNVLLKQPGEIPPSQKPWEFSPAVEVVQPVVQQPQVVFVQPVVSHCNSKEASSKRRRPKKYIPILRSYPKIAPHPGDSSSSSGRGTSCSSSSSSGSERGRGLASGHRGRHHVHRGKQQRHQSGSSCSSGSTTPVLAPHTTSLSPSPQLRLSHTPSLSLTDSSACSSPASPSPAVSRSEFTPAPSPALTLTSEPPKKPQVHPEPATTDNNSRNDGYRGGDGNRGDDDIKRKRFCNTYNILSKSGLLDITLRTKDLLRQNRRTQGELDRLKEHTSLFLQAITTGDTGVWCKLQTSLQEEKGGGWASSLTPDAD